LGTLKTFGEELNYETTNSGIVFSILFLFYVSQKEILSSVAPSKTLKFIMLQLTE
jgi:hypothetical protein